MKILVDEMPYFKTDCPFCEDGYQEDHCKAGHGQECVYFKNGRNSEDCPYLKEIDSK